MPGFPIRTPSDHSLVDNSPRTIAASHVLHRLLMPRHPPCALNNLTTTRCSHPLCNTQHTTTPQPHDHHHTHHRDALDGPSQERPENHTTPTTGDHRCPLRTQQRAEPPQPHKRTAGHRSVGFAFHPANPPHTTRRTRQRTASWNQRKENQPRRHPTHPSVKQHQHEAGHPTNTMGLLRKEVIQPHLPVRLPCYDFVPIASPTFDNSLPQGVRPSASGVTNFRDVTGGVYKARERIHRSVADLRLLATPTSRGRVADPDPN